MAFEVVGPERSGLVALEVRKKHVSGGPHT